MATREGRRTRETRLSTRLAIKTSMNPAHISLLPHSPKHQEPERIPNLTSLGFSIPCQHQNSFSAWLAKTKHRLTTFQPTPGVSPAHSATPSAQPHTPASLFLASVRTASHLSIEETRHTVHREVEEPFRPRANLQTYCPSQTHRN